MTGEQLRAQHWETCLHEAGHIVCAMRLNRWDTSCHAEVFDTGGLATMPRGLSDFADAAARAAGYYGGLLARLYCVPRKRSPGPAGTVHQEAVRAVAASWITDAQVDHKKTITEHTDEEQLRRYAINTNSMDHNEWGRRLRRARAAGRLTVWRHRMEVKAVATVLFREGIFVHIGCKEHNDFHR